MDGVTQPSLFDALAAEGESIVRHMVLPNFSIACGRDYLELVDRGQTLGHRLTTLSTRETTCPACLATGDLAEQCRRLTGRQADARS